MNEKHLIWIVTMNWMPDRPTNRKHTTSSIKSAPKALSIIKRALLFEVSEVRPKIPQAFPQVWHKNNHAEILLLVEMYQGLHHRWVQWIRIIHNI